MQLFYYLKIAAFNGVGSGMTGRGTVSNFLDHNNDFFRTIFDEDRLAENIAFHDERFRSFGSIFTLAIVGTI